MAPKRPLPASSSEEDSEESEDDCETAPKMDTFRRAQEEIVYAVIGPENMRFALHKDHLCSTSPYFKTALRGDFQEAALGEVALPDFDAGAFTNFFEWLYTGRISEDLCEENGLSALQIYTNDAPSLPQLLDVWLLADYLMVPRLQNHAVDMMSRKMRRRKVIALADFSYIYGRTEEGSPVHQLIVEMCVWNSFGGNGLGYLQTPDVVPEEMGLDLLVALTRRHSKCESNPLDLKKRYHVPELA